MEGTEKLNERKPLVDQGVDVCEQGGVGSLIINMFS
jgi:hypothetical protein